MTPIKEAAKAILRSSNTVALTGAGISVESGIPDFRSPDGLWSRYDPLEYGHIGSFRSNPEKVWKMLLEIDELLAKARPNRAHEVLANLEKMGFLKAVITQNIDSLHQRAGSKNVIEYHGHNRSLRCETCGKVYPRAGVDFSRLPPLCECGGLLRPEFVFFGEPIPGRERQMAEAAAAGCDVMLVIGTSGSVAPANYLPHIAKSHGARIVEINPNETELPKNIIDIIIREKAGIALQQILDIIESETKQ